MDKARIPKTFLYRASNPMTFTVSLFQIRRITVHELIHIPDQCYRQMQKTQIQVHSRLNERSRFTMNGPSPQFRVEAFYNCSILQEYSVQAQRSDSFLTL
jgi:hypothetical protein